MTKCQVSGTRKLSLLRIYLLKRRNRLDVEMDMKSYDLGNLSILVLEKHLLVRKLLSDVFSEFGFATTFSTSDPVVAYDFFRNMTTDIILLDWTPDLDGLKFLRQVRNAPDSPNPFVPAVVTSANTDLNFISTDRDDGMTEFLAKPVTARSIYRRICNLIENPRPFIRVGQFFGPDRRRRSASSVGEDRRQLMAAE